MKQILQTVLITIILSSISGISFAQQNNEKEVSIDVSANILSTIEIVTIQSINLTEAERTNEIITINPQSSSNAGKMVAVGRPNSDIRISYLKQRELTQQRGSSTLQFIYNLAGNEQDDQSSAEILDSENRDFEFNEDGRFYLWIGGRVDISNAAPGNYQGEFTLNIEYI